MFQKSLSSIALAITLVAPFASLRARAQSLPGLTPPADGRMPRIGILVPVGPPDYRVITDVFHKDRTDTFGEISFQVGTLYGFPTVLSFAPGQGPLLRSLAAQSMFEHYNIKTVIYPGTSGAHLGAASMRIGDIVLGAENVDFGNYFMARDGTVASGQFGSVGQKDTRRFRTFYADPTLLRYIACSANRVAPHNAVPAWVNTGPTAKSGPPEIFFYGIQGTTTAWIAEPTLVKKLTDAFKMIDEDGDWYSNLSAALYHVPFIEVSTIANSIPEYPQSERGFPATPKGQDSTDVQAQRISNRVALDLIQHYGTQLLSGTFGNPGESPYPAANFADPKNPQKLLDGMDCN